jgi:catechol 2,3-dioxygenase-like lactoylglutathione lyase family enzyme
MIHHINYLVTRDQARECAVFWELLGFESVDPGDDLRDRAVWVRRAGQEIHFEHAPRDRQDAARIGEGPPAGHVALVVDDFDQVCAQIEARGGSVDHRTPYWGSPRAFITDPAGHRIEIMAHPPAE